MAIAMKTRVLLWARAGGLCSRCRAKLVMSATETDDEALVGECAHMIAEEDNGPRGDPAMPVEQRNRYGNLILLCRNCHKVVDDQVNTFTLAALQDAKTAHEKAIAEQLDRLAKERLDSLTVYAGYVEEWAQRVDLDGWSKWTYAPMSDGQPRMRKAKYYELADLTEWLFNRIWPKTLPELEDAFVKFRIVLADFWAIFRKHREEWGDDYITQKFYKIREWDPELYKKLADEYEKHVDLVEDLVLELTRAANLVCDKVRQHLDPTFRYREGVLLASSGPYMPDFGTHLHRAEYGDNETNNRFSYPGLEAFAVESGRTTLPMMRKTSNLRGVQQGRAWHSTRFTARSSMR